MQRRVARENGNHYFRPNAEIAPDKPIFAEAFAGLQIQIDVGAEAPLDRRPGWAPRRVFCAVCTAKIESGRQSVIALSERSKVSRGSPSRPARSVLDQGRVVDRERSSVGSLDIDHEVGVTGRDRVDHVGHGFCFDQIDRPGCSLRVTPAWPIAQHLALVASGEKRKAPGVGRALEGEKAIAIHAAVADEELIALFAAHAFDRITPKALCGSNDAHAQEIRSNRARKRVDKARGDVTQSFRSAAR